MREPPPPPLNSHTQHTLSLLPTPLQTYLTPAKTGVDHWNIITQGTRHYRPPPGSNPQPTIPTEARGRTYDIKYYTRDVRRNPDGDATVNRPIELSLPASAQAALPREPVLEGEGSPGLKNPDALRYDPQGARNAMTTNWAALKAGLAAARPTQLPRPAWEAPALSALGPVAAADALARRARVEKQANVWAGVPKDARRRGWDYTQLANYNASKPYFS